MAVLLLCFILFVEIFTSGASFLDLLRIDMCIMNRFITRYLTFFLSVVHISQEQFIQSTSYLAGVLLRTCFSVVWTHVAFNRNDLLTVNLLLLHEQMGMGAGHDCVSSHK